MARREPIHGSRARESTPAVVLVGVTRTFRTAGESIRALDSVSVECAAGALTVVAGASGSGKSTLLAIVAGIDRPDVGTVHIDGHEIATMSRRDRRRLRRDRITLVLPQPSENLFDHLDAGANVAWAATHAGQTADVGRALAAVGLGDRADARVRELSGGEQQRVALAAALAARALVVAADEPTASLDRTSSAAVIDALVAAARAGACVIVATHDADVIAAADQVVALEHGRRTR